MVLERVVQQRGDRLVLVAAVAEHELANAEQVRDVRDRRAFPHVVAVQRGCQYQGFVEAFAQTRHRPLTGVRQDAPSTLQPYLLAIRTSADGDASADSRTYPTCLTARSDLRSGSSLCRSLDRWTSSSPEYSV